MQDFFCEAIPHFYKKIFMVSSVQVQVTRIDKKTHKQDHWDPYEVFSLIYKITVKNIWVVPWGETVLVEDQKEII